ncbi:MAG: DUF2927 domain-containing protein [Proteobacteria bacterium]|nr:DUF2927 domain-containing protein [Pseudomonadota bacterium]
MRLTACLRVPVLALAVLLTAGSPVRAAETRASDAALIGFFEAVVFRSEYESVTPSTRLKKWLQPLRVTVSSLSGKVVPKPSGGKELKLKKQRPAARNIKIIQKHLRTLVRLTGVRTEDAKKVKKPANLAIKFVPRLAMAAPFMAKEAPPDLLKKLAAPGVCYFLTWAVESGAIVKGIIVVNNQLPPEDLEACLLEEMTQVMGLPNDSDLVSPSVFNRSSQPRRLSRSDRILIRTVYDKRMAPGAPKDEAMVLARKIIPELNRVVE